VAPAVNRLLSRVLFTPQPQWNAEKIAAAHRDCVEEFDAWEPQFRGDYLAGPLSAADLTLYPMVALALRCEYKKPDVDVRAALPPQFDGWMQRIQSLPYFSKTWPAHWK
jgi:glutathione S-transferase